MYFKLSTKGHNTKLIEHLKYYDTIAIRIKYFNHIFTYYFLINKEI